MSKAHPAMECGTGGQGINQFSEVTYHQIQHGVQGEGRMPREEGFPAKQSRNQLRSSQHNPQYYNSPCNLVTCPWHLRVPDQRDSQPPILWVINPPLSALLAGEAESKRMDRMLSLFVPSWPTHGAAVISRITQ